MVKTVGFLVIGDEILNGRTADKNINFLARTLDDNGYQLSEVRIIPDNADSIVSAVQQYALQFDYVFTSGGIGGTHDDITFSCVAQATGKDIECNQIAYDCLDVYYKSKGFEWTETRKNMTLMPAGCDVLDNPVSLAPGAVVDNIFVCAGIPKIFNVMVQDALLRYMSGGIPIYKESIFLDGVGEGAIGDTLRQIANTYPDVNIGSYPHFTDKGFSTEIVMRSHNKHSLKLCFSEIQDFTRNFINH